MNDLNEFIDRLIEGKVKKINKAKKRKFMIAQAKNAANRYKDDDLTDVPDDKILRYERQMGRFRKPDASNSNRVKPPKKIKTEVDFKGIADILKQTQAASKKYGPPREDSGTNHMKDIFKVLIEANIYQTSAKVGGKTITKMSKSKKPGVSKGKAHAEAGKNVASDKAAKKRGSRRKSRHTYNWVETIKDRDRTDKEFEEEDRYLNWYYHGGRSL